MLAQTMTQLAPKHKAPKDPNAPKRPRGRPRKDGSMPRQGDQRTDSDSDSDSDLSVEEEPEKTPALLSVQVPTDERGRAMYQAVQAVWSPRNLTAPVEKMKSGMAQFGDTIKALRDSWKDKNESLRKAELPNSPTAGLIPKLKADVAHYRLTVETVVNRSLQHAHPAILKRYVFLLTIPYHSQTLHTRIYGGNMTNASFWSLWLRALIHGTGLECACAPARRSDALARGFDSRSTFLLDSLRICSCRVIRGSPETNKYHPPSFGRFLANSLLQTRRKSMDNVCVICIHAGPSHSRRPRQHSGFEYSEGMCTRPI